MHWRRSFWLRAAALLVLAGPLAVAGPRRKPPTLPVPPALAPTTRPFRVVGTRPSDDPSLQGDALAGLYKSELGSLYHEEDFEKLYTVHQLLESFFATSSAGERKSIAADIAASGVNPTAIGRMTRIRLNWPALPGGAIYYVNERHGPFNVRYFCGVPANYDRTRSWPLVIKLPTASAFLTSPLPDADRVVEIYTGWIRAELEHHPDAAVLMPLLNFNELWGPSYVGMSNVIQPMLHAANRLNIDPSRVYLIGHSESAHATWNLALHYPTYFAAFNPLAGGASADWQRLRLIGLKNVLPVVWHDADDVVLKPELSRSIVKALRGLKIDVDYIETKNIGHAPTAAVAEECYDKLIARQRDLYPHDVSIQTNRPDPIFNRNDWVQLWQALTPGKDRRLYFRHGSGYMIVDQNTSRVDATLSGQRIDLKTDNVESLRVYLNDQMLDLTKPITINVNKRGKFEGFAKPRIVEMLNDQLFIGRGWRYYTSYLDVDLVPPASTRPSSQPTTDPATGNSVARPTTVKSAPHGGTITVGPSKE